MTNSKPETLNSKQTQRFKTQNLVQVGHLDFVFWVYLGFGSANFNLFIAFVLIYAHLWIKFMRRYQTTQTNRLLGNLTTPSFLAKRVKSLANPTFIPGL